MKTVVRYAARHTAVLCLALIAAPRLVHAAVFCVGNSTQLQSALSTSGSNGESDTIRVKTGTYTGTGSSVAFAYSTSEDFGLSILGGYVDAGAVVCGGRLADPALTVISGSGVRQAMRLSPASGTEGPIRVDRLTLRNGNALERGGGIFIGANNFVGRIAIERVYFDHSEAAFGGGLSIIGGSAVVVRNNLFNGNTASGGGANAEVTNNAIDPNLLTVEIGNNTVFGGHCDGSCSTGGFVLSGTMHGVLFNNLFAMNDGNDVQILLPSTEIDLIHNNINQLSGTPGLQAGNLNIINPQFVDFLVDDFHLKESSPMRNAGDETNSVGVDAFDGIDRVLEGAVDIGAYEVQPLFANGFETLM
jgi:hypothetical protein